MTEEQAGFFAAHLAQRAVKALFQHRRHLKHTKWFRMKEGDNYRVLTKEELAQVKEATKKIVGLL